MVCIWEVESGKVLYKVRWVMARYLDVINSPRVPICAKQLPGHKGTVTAVDFHPREPVSE
jgi:hypothetical protein